MPVKILSVETGIVDLPLRRSHRFGGGVMRRQSLVVVRLHSEEDLTGVGEAVVPGGGPHWGGESVETMKTIIDTYLAPALCASPVDGLNDLLARLDRAASANRFAKAGVEMAMVDLLGKRLGCSASDLFGGPRRGRLPVLWSVGADVEDPVAELEDRLDAGHKMIKFMVTGGEPSLDAKRILALLPHVPDAIEVVVDFNGRWSEGAVHRWLPALAAAGVNIAEQPVAADNNEAMTRITARGLATVLADEAVQSPAAAARIAYRRAGDAVAVKIPKCGGMLRAWETAAVAGAGGLDRYGGAGPWRLQSEPPPPLNSSVPGPTPWAVISSAPCCSLRTSSLTASSTATVS